MPIEILMPALSPTMTEGTLAKWVKKEGDEVKSGQVIAEIETDKATMEVEAVDEGKLGKILISAGTEGVPVNEVIALLLEEGEDKKALDNYKPAKQEKAEGNTAKNEDKKEDKKPEGKTETVTIQRKDSKAPTPPKSKTSTAGEIKASPIAKRIAKEKGVALANVIGTGPHGRIIKEDVERAVLRGGAGGTTQRDSSEFITMPNSGMRKTVAKRLLEAKQQMPHFYLSVDCELDRLLDIRKQLNAKAAGDAGKEGKPAYKLSVNDFVIRASALALKKVPEANSSWYDDAIVQYTNVDISIAVAIEGGLITPIVKNADQKSVQQISKEMKTLAEKARAGKLQPEEYQGGGFSISNLGMYGIRQFSAIINPPQSCILAIGAGEERVVIKDGKMTPATVMTVTISVDHRSVDGAVGAKFLAAFKEFIEQPITMFA